MSPESHILQDQLWGLALLVLIWVRIHHYGKGSAMLFVGLGMSDRQILKEWLYRRNPLNSESLRWQSLQPFGARLGNFISILQDFQSYQHDGWQAPSFLGQPLLAPVLCRLVWTLCHCQVNPSVWHSGNLLPCSSEPTQKCTIILLESMILYPIFKTWELSYLFCCYSINGNLLKVSFLVLLILSCYYGKWAFFTFKWKYK